MKRQLWQMNPAASWRIQSRAEPRKISLSDDCLLSITFARVAAFSPRSLNARASARSWIKCTSVSDAYTCISLHSLWSARAQHISEPRTRGERINGRKRKRCHGEKLTPDWNFRLCMRRNSVAVLKMHFLYTIRFFLTKKKIQRSSNLHLIYGRKIMMVRFR